MFLIYQKKNSRMVSLVGCLNLIVKVKGKQAFTKGKCCVLCKAAANFCLFVFKVYIFCAESSDIIAETSQLSHGEKKTSKLKKKKKRHTFDVTDKQTDKKII